MESYYLVVEFIHHGCKLQSYIIVIIFDENFALDFSQGDVAANPGSIFKPLLPNGYGKTKV